MLYISNLNTAVKRRVWCLNMLLYCSYCSTRIIKSIHVLLFELCKQNGNVFNNVCFHFIKPAEHYESREARQASSSGPDRRKGTVYFLTYLLFYSCCGDKYPKVLHLAPVFGSTIAHFMKFKGILDSARPFLLTSAVPLRYNTGWPPSSVAPVALFIFTVRASDTH